MNALVTGGTGFVGSHLVARLTSESHSVTALVRSPSKAGPLLELGARIVVGDLADSRAMLEAAADQDAVFHVAALTGARTEAELITANRDGTAALAAATRSASPRARFVLVSSAAAGGPAQPGVPRIDTTCDHPVTGYGRTKLAAEMVTRESELDWTILRPPTVYGPGDTVNLLPIFRSISRFGVGPVFGDGTQELSLIHVDDLASACITAATTPATGNRLYYVNHPETISSRDLVERIGVALNRRVRVLALPHPVVRAALVMTETWANLRGQATILRADKANEFLQRAWTGDPAPFMRDSTWRPDHDLDSGLAQTAAWYREQRSL